MPTPTVPRLQTRSSAGIDRPAAGRWSLRNASFVAYTEGRRGFTRVRMLDGWIEVADPVEDSLLMEIRTDHPSATRLLAWADSFIGDHNGFARWPLEGAIHDLDGDRRDLNGELVFHGVYRHGEQQWAWLSGKAVVQDCRRRTAQRGVMFELFADPTLDAAQ